MSPQLTSPALAIPGYLSLGHLHLPIYGLFAAAGLIAALTLSQRAAKFVNLPAEKLWDAGMFAIIAAFIASRLLLIAMDLKSFLAYPFLMLALPSLTYGGMMLTGILTWFYLQRKHLPVLDVLDAWAPCAALLAAVLSVGHFVEGTDAGMPTRLPWAVHTPGDSVLGKVHPVQLYAMLAALALCEFLLIRLKKHRKQPGQVAALALILGGIISFALDMFRQPFDTFGELPLDPSQFVAIAAIVAGAWLFLYKPTPPRAPFMRAHLAHEWETTAARITTTPPNHQEPI